MVNKKFFSVFIIIITVMVLTACGADKKEEKRFVDFNEEEQKQAMAEARKVIEEFNQINIVDSKKELEQIVKNTWINPDDVAATMDELYENIKSRELEKIDIEFSDEEILESKKGEYFIYEARMRVRVTDKNDETNEYSDHSRYIFKHTGDGYKIEKIDGAR